MQQKGERVASDDWCIGWNLSVSDGAYIAAWNPQGVRQYVISGEITAEYVEREIERFLADHSGQMEMGL